MTTDLEVLVKASPLRALRSYMDEALKPEERARVLRKAAEEFPGHVAFLGEQLPLVSERLPVILVNRLIELTAAELHQPAVAVAHRVGRRSADESSRGVLRLMMVLVSMESLLRKMVPTWKQMNTHGTMTSHVDDRAITIELTDFPIKSAIGCARLTGTFEWFAQKAAAAAVIRHDLCRARDGGDVCRWNIPRIT